jgi:hypothetical protein
LREPGARVLARGTAEAWHGTRAFERNPSKKNAALLRGNHTARRLLWGKTRTPTVCGAEDRLTAARLRDGGRTAKPKRDGANPSPRGESPEVARCGRTQSRTAAHRKPRTKNEKRRRTIREEDTRRSRRRAIGNPSACFVEGEYGPGRTDEGSKNKTHGWILRRREEKIPHGLESTPKITPKMKISDPKQEHHEHPKFRFFSMEIQHGSHTAEVTALPPSF